MGSETWNAYFRTIETGSTFNKQWIFRELFQHNAIENLERHKLRCSQLLWPILLPSLMVDPKTRLQMKRESTPHHSRKHSWLKARFQRCCLSIRKREGQSAGEAHFSPRCALLVASLVSIAPRSARLCACSACLCARSACFCARRAWFCARRSRCCLLTSSSASRACVRRRAVQTVTSCAHSIKLSNPCGNGRRKSSESSSSKLCMYSRRCCLGDLTALQLFQYHLHAVDHEL